MAGSEIERLVRSKHCGHSQFYLIDAEHQLARRRRGVDRCTMAREHLKTDAARAEVVDDVDEMAQVAAQSVE